MLPNIAFRMICFHLPPLIECGNSMCIKRIKGSYFNSISLSHLTTFYEDKNIWNILIHAPGFTLKAPNGAFTLT